MSSTSTALPLLHVLGVAQDGGHPQPGCRRPCCAHGRHLPSCLAVVDPVSGQRWLLDATPALPEQLDRLDAVAPAAGPAPALAGMLLTHAHIGHYAGLIHLGREVMGARGVALHVMPRLAGFLSSNGPWSQLVELGNVRLEVGGDVALNDRLSARAIVVPHRDEYSETVAWRIQGPGRAVLYLPDIDAWDGWDRRLEEVVADVDAAWIDGTFWDDAELGRDMGEIPHPRVRATLDRISRWPAAERAKIRFTHLNHTNPLLDAASAESADVRSVGANVAREGDVYVLG